MPDHYDEERELFGAREVDFMLEQLGTKVVQPIFDNYEKLRDSETLHGGFLRGTERFAGGTIRGSIENVEASKDPFNLEDEYGSSNAIINAAQITSGYALRGAGKALEWMNYAQSTAGKAGGDVAYELGIDPRLVRYPIEFGADLVMGKLATKIPKYYKYAKALTKIADQPAVQVGTGINKSPINRKVLNNLRRQVSGEPDLINSFIQAKKKGNVEEMSRLYTLMDDLDKKELDLFERGIQNKAIKDSKLASSRFVPSSNFPYLYNIKNLLSDWRVGTRGKFNWYRFNRLTHDQKRFIAGRYSTDQFDRIPISWSDYSKQQKEIFEVWYGKRTDRIIDLDHGITLIQSMPIYQGLDAGSPMFNKIQERFLRHALRPGDAVSNLRPLDRTVHSLKTAYFNKLHGEFGKDFFTDEIIRKFNPGPNWTQAQADAFRLQTLEKYIGEVKIGEDIIDRAQKIYHYLHTKDVLIPEQMVDALTDVLTSKKDITKYTSKELRRILKQIDATPEGRQYLLTGLQDQILDLKDQIFKIESELTIPGNPIMSQAAEDFKLKKLSELEKQYQRLSRQQLKLIQQRP